MMPGMRPPQGGSRSKPSLSLVLSKPRVSCNHILKQTLDLNAKQQSGFPSPFLLLSPPPMF